VPAAKPATRMMMQVLRHLIGIERIIREDGRPRPIVSASQDYVAAIPLVCFAKPSSFSFKLFCCALLRLMFSPLNR
jgi:hypothetical protein